jgi:hypothetical protein
MHHVIRYGVRRHQPDPQFISPGCTGRVRAEEAESGKAARVDTASHTRHAAARTLLLSSANSACEGRALPACAIALWFSFAAPRSPIAPLVAMQNFVSNATEAQLNGTLQNEDLTLNSAGQVNRLRPPAPFPLFYLV